MYIVHSVRPVDRHIYKSPVYNIFYLVYDRDLKVVKHFYFCKVCRNFQNVVLSADGNSKLRRHKCYKSYQRRHQTNKKYIINEEEDDDDDSISDRNIESSDDEEIESDIDDGRGKCGKSGRDEITKGKMLKEHFHLLSNTLSKFSELCMKSVDAGPFKSTEIARILPHDWKNSDW